MEHFLLECEKLGKEGVELQQPYEENIKKIMGIVLFKEEGIEKRKEKIIICGEKELKVVTKRSNKKKKEKEEH